MSSPLLPVKLCPSVCHARGFSLISPFFFPPPPTDLWSMLGLAFSTRNTFSTQFLCSFIFSRFPLRPACFDGIPTNLYLVRLGSLYIAPPLPLHAVQVPVSPHFRLRFRGVLSMVLLQDPLLILPSVWLVSSKPPVLPFFFFFYYVDHHPAPQFTPHSRFFLGIPVLWAFYRPLLFPTYPSFTPSSAFNRSGLLEELWFPLFKLRVRAWRYCTFFPRVRA